MIKFVLLIFIVIFSIKALAYQSIASGFDYVLPAPPTTDNIQSLYQYLYTMYQQWMTGQVTTTFPNGNVDSAYGNIAIYYDGTNYWLMVQTAQPSGSSWVGTKLGAI